MWRSGVRNNDNLMEAMGLEPFTSALRAIWIQIVSLYVSSQEGAGSAKLGWPLVGVCFFAPARPQPMRLGRQLEELSRQRQARDQVSAGDGVKARTHIIQ